MEWCYPLNRYNKYGPINNLTYGKKSTFLKMRVFKKKCEISRDGTIIVGSVV